MIEISRSLIINKADFNEILNMQTEDDNYKVFIVKKYIVGTFFIKLFIFSKIKGVSITDFCMRRKK